jgi:hypothetical protein
MVSGRRRRTAFGFHWRRHVRYCSGMPHITAKIPAACWIVVLGSVAVACGSGSDPKTSSAATTASVVSPTASTSSSSTSTTRAVVATTVAPTTTTAPAFKSKYSSAQVNFTTSPGWMYQLVPQIQSDPILVLGKDVTQSPPGRARLTFTVTTPANNITVVGVTPGRDTPKIRVGLGGIYFPFHTSSEGSGINGPYGNFWADSSSNVFSTSAPCTVNIDQFTGIAKTLTGVHPGFTPGFGGIVCSAGMPGTTDKMYVELREAGVDYVIKEMTPMPAPILSVEIAGTGKANFSGCSLMLFPDGSADVEKYLGAGTC